VEIIQIKTKTTILPFKNSYSSIIAVADGMKKNGMFLSRKSPTSSMLLSFSNLNVSSINITIIAITLPGKEIGKTGATTSQIRQMPPIIAICFKIFKTTLPFYRSCILYTKIQCTKLTGLLIFSLKDGYV
jgi:hypothetical protein